MNTFRKTIYKANCIFFAILTLVSPFFNMIKVEAETAINYLKGGYVRSTPSTALDANNIIGSLSVGAEIEVLEIVPSIDDSLGCTSKKWYKFMFNGTIAYSCTSNFDNFDRPWTTPGKSIIGGAMFKRENYVAKGQFTSYLFKFNVNPNSAHAVYTHQYMSNVRAPADEANTSYNIYLDNNLLNQALTFSIPIYNNMPEYTNLPQSNPNTTGMTAEELNDPTFEEQMNVQGFDETYKKKLRVLHLAYPNWIFESLRTNLDWDTAVASEQPESYVDGSDVSLRESFEDAKANDEFCKNTTGPYCLREGSNWYLANAQTVAYYMDPRNFLRVERILMFEKLTFSEVYTEEIIQSRLNSTFMSGISPLDDNRTYASIFIEAGRKADLNPVYLTSQCLQEVGTNGSVATTGEEFTYRNVTYKGLYNFFNVGATDPYSPAKSGLVWANAGSLLTIVSNNPDPATIESNYISALGLAKTSGYITGVALNQMVQSLNNKLSDATLTITDMNGATLSSSSKLTTGTKIIINDNDNTFTNTVVIYGDISGDGEINAIDLLYMRKQLLGTHTLTGANLQAAKIAKGNKVGAADLLYLRKYLLDRETYKITQ